MCSKSKSLVFDQCYFKENYFYIFIAKMLEGKGPTFAFYR